MLISEQDSRAMPSTARKGGGVVFKQQSVASPLLLSILAAACVGCLGCAPGCAPLLGIVSQWNGSAALVPGACYSVASAASTVALSVPGTSNNTQPTWASAVSASQPPVLDLCNQVQSISLQGESEPGRRAPGEVAQSVSRHKTL